MELKGKVSEKLTLKQNPERMERTSHADILRDCSGRVAKTNAKALRPAQAWYVKKQQTGMAAVGREGERR